MRAYLVDVGILLSDKCEEFDKYSKVYDEQYGYYDENQFYVKDKAEAVKQTREYVQNGAETTYAVVSETNIPYDYDFEEGTVEGESYHRADVVYSAAKIDGAIVEDFVAARKFIVEKSFLEKCYDLYKIDWCTRHDVNPEDIDEEIGIFGECFVCLAEFAQNEFQDRAYIKSLLQSDAFGMKEENAATVNKLKDFQNVSVFIFDDELYFGQDEACETADGYLWASDTLVRRLMEAIKDRHDPSVAETFDNINFYPIYNLRSCTIKLEATYYYDDGTGEKQGEFEIPLSDAERADLIDAMEVYCKKKNGKSCTEQLNEYRVADGLDPISILPDKLAKKYGLEHVIADAEARHAHTQPSAIKSRERVTENNPDR